MNSKKIIYPVQHCVEHVGSFLGIEIPANMRFFDVRCPEEDLFAARKPWSPELSFGLGEKAKFVLGLLYGVCRYHSGRPQSAHAIWYTKDDGSTPAHIDFYFDARDPENNNDLIRVIQDTIKIFQDRRQEFNDAVNDGCTKNSKSGGSYLAKPIAAYLANWGTGIIVDEQDYIIRPFKS